MRLIDADALLLQLSDYQLQESPTWGANGYGNQDKYDAITDCIKAIEDAPTIEPEPQWIPCSERTPEENGRYLTTNSSWDFYEVDWNAWINGEWLYPNEDPVAWMPMPESYQEGKQHE